MDRTELNNPESVRIIAHSAMRRPAKTVEPILKQEAESKVKSDELNDLLFHMEWADSCLWQTVLEGESRDPRVESTFHHIHLVQHAFLSLWRGEALDLPEVSAFETPASLVRWGRQGHLEIQEFLARTEASTFRRELAIPWTEELAKRWEGPVQAVTVQQSMLQVAMHSAHHRGQVAMRLREMEVEPPLFDFIAWLWQGRPSARWPPSAKG